MIFRRVCPNLRAIIGAQSGNFGDGQTHAEDSFNEEFTPLVTGRRARHVGVCKPASASATNTNSAAGADFYGFDEVTEFTRTLVEFITGWKLFPRSATALSNCDELHRAE